jgi:Fic family protein
MFDSQLPYNDLPKLPPPHEIETKSVLKRAITANKALAELRCSGEWLPNQGIFIQALTLQEAKLSSEIESIVTTHDDLYRAFSSASLDDSPQTKEVLHYKEALWHGFEHIIINQMPISTNLMEKLFEIVKRIDGGVRKTTGTKLRNPATGEIVYTPPEGEETIRRLLSNLETFINTTDIDDLDPLVKLAVMHYQFEAIHPFGDGNGRVGRILNILFLVSNGLLDIPVLYLSKYIIENKNDYYKNLRKVTEDHDWEPWILYMLTAIIETSQATHHKIMEIKKLMDETAKKIKEENHQIYSLDLVRIIHQQPYCKISFLVDAGIAQKQTASKYLQALADMGILLPLKKGREVYYINHKLFDILKK